MTRTVADQFVDTLRAAGVKRIFGVVGDSLNGLTDAVRRRGDIEWVPVRHEEVAAFAAGAEAHLTGSLAVCAGSCGPGNLHLINGLFDCHRSGVPVLAIAAHIPSPEIGTGYFQETHPQTLFQECSHYCELVSDPEQMPRTLEIAIREAVSKRGVSVVTIPGNVALLPATEAPTARTSSLLPAAPVVTPAGDELVKLAEMLNSGRRITVLCGSGCQGAHDQLISVCERLNAPVVHALRGKEHVEWDNPYDVGMTGLIGFSSGYYAMLDCDVLLMLGTDFPYRQFYPREARCAHRPGRHPERSTLDVVHRSTSESWETSERRWRPCCRCFSRIPTPPTCRRRASITAKTRKGLDDLAEPGRAGPIHPQQIAKALSDQAADDAVFTCDVGLPTVWAARYLAMNGKRRLIGSFWHGSMANAMPHGDRRPSRISRQAGDLAVGRRRLHHADGRLPEPRRSWACR